MFWSGETLIERLPGIANDFRSEDVDCNAWALTVGGRYYVSPTAKTPKDGSHTIRNLSRGESFAIPPGQFGFLQAHETVKMPSYAMGFISMKLEHKSQGLVNISGFHVDPGFEGILVFTVFNAGPTDVHLTVGEKCFLLWFAGLDRDSAKVKTSPYPDGISGKHVKNIAGELQSISELSGRVSEIENKLSRYVWGAGLLGAFLSIFISGIAFFASGISNYVSSQKTVDAPPTTQRAPIAASSPAPATPPAPPPTTAGAPSDAR